MTLLILFTAAALIVISGVTLSNILIMQRLQPKETSSISYLPFVSVMVPARDESAVIATTIQHLLAQDYPNYELIVLDDNSTDDTAEIARQTATLSAHGERLKIMQGEPLPGGWMGKNWACHQMAQVAQGEILLFTDADTQWAPGALTSLVGAMQRSNADLYSVWPTQETLTWGERLTVPLIALVIMGYLPLFGTYYVPLAAFGAANGQCMAWRRRAYHNVGGHATIRGNVLEDVTLARMVKAQGLRLRLADGNRQITCRMYPNWPAVRDGFAKNILAGYGSVVALILGTIFHWLIFLLPWLWLILGQPEPHPTGPLALITLGLTLRALTAAFTHQRITDALAMPISVLLMTRITLQAIYWHYHGGPRWKGRTIPKQSAHQHSGASHG